MRKTPISRNRKWLGLALLALVVLALVWHFSPGLPVLFGPWASASTKQAGMELFVHEWQHNDPLAHGDGVGPVFNAASCVACHNQGGVGGGGGLEHNVQTYTVLPTNRDPEVRTGAIHANATLPAFQETFDLVRQRFPVIKGGTRVVNHCTINVADLDPLHTDQVQTTSLFGAGWIDRISDKAIVTARRKHLLTGLIQEFKLDFDSIPPGRARRLPDGRIGKFGWKGQFATLEEFVAAACANEIGLGTPPTKQATPISSPGYAPDAPADLTRKQFNAMVAFCETLPRPVESAPASAGERERAGHGKKIFSSVGCAVCHTPDMGGVKGVYSDFLLHRLDDGIPDNGGPGYGSVPEVPLPDEFPRLDEWKTPPLWGVADSAPYMHDGSAPTLEAAIMRHGRDAKAVRDAYRKLAADEQQAVIAFLQTLKAPPDAQSAKSFVKK